MTLTLILLAVCVPIGGAMTWWLRSSKPTAEAADQEVRPMPPAPRAISAQAPAAEPEYSNEAIDGVIADCFRLAFGVTRFDYQIIGPHAAVLDAIGASIDESVRKPEYFPRRPRLLPKLIQTINDTDTTRRELVKLILEDPAMAGTVLQRANSAFYRVSAEPVESLDRAVMLLGTDGLRSLMATALMQPVFRLPKGYFDQFATITWEQAQRTAAAAEAHAKATQAIDPFVGQLLGLLGSLAKIVLFRLTMDKYRESPGILPRAEVFIRTIEAHGARVAMLIATAWEMSDISIAGLDQQVRRVPPATMGPTGRTIYFAELCGALAMLGTRNIHSQDGAYAMLMAQGLDRDTTYAIWHAATTVETEA